MRYGSVCSGIEAATVAWHPLGWKPQWYSEIEKFPCSVLAHHYPDVPNLGDMTKIYEREQCVISSWSDAPDGDAKVDDQGGSGDLFGGHDGRGNSGDRHRGVVQTNDFDTFLSGLRELGYGCAWRVLDAQYFGVPQRRRRVFVVGYLGDWRRAAAVLFEQHSLSGNPAPSRQAGEGTAPDVGFCVTARGGSGRCDPTDGTGRGTPLVFESRFARNGRGAPEEVCPPLKAESGETGKDDAAPCVAFNWQENHCFRVGEVANPLRVEQTEAAMVGSAVRRLTPRECERLQGFPDDYTKLPGNDSDGPRYKALGNSMAVPVMAWIGQRIQQVDSL